MKKDRKKNRKRIRFTVGMMSLALASSFVAAPLATAVSVYAASDMARGISNVVTPGGVANFGKGTASITVSGNNASKSLVGKSFHIYQLFHAENAAGMESINYTFSEGCKEALQNVVGARLHKTPADVTEYEVIDYIQSLNNHKIEGADAAQTEEGYYSEFRYFIEDLRDELVKLGNDAADTVMISEVKEDGTVTIGGLDYGYYILDEVTDNQGGHCASSLCIVNTANPTAGVKVKSDYPDVYKEIREDDDRETVGNEGWNDMADYEIGQTVPYRFTSNVPDMNGYDTYYYAWHDIMDEALTFDPDSVEISIFEGDMEYRLSASEYRVEENVDGETFRVIVSDLKAIVDRAFNHKNSLGHNTYGQEVVVTYHATLNDKAADRTGLPGFENKVRLEFSNDADSDGKGETGFTPWIPVVCFTYRLDGLKINEHNVELEGAKFRLYNDEDCTDEVYVKKAEQGYIVIHDDSVSGTKPADSVEMVSDKEGVFTIIGLDSGTYYLKETDAPDGYRQLLDPIKIDIEATFVEDRNSYVEGDGALGKALTNLTFTADTRQFLNGIMKDESTELNSDVQTGTGNLTVINSIGSKLPATGSSATIIILGIGCVLMIGAGIYAKKKKIVG